MTNLQMGVSYGHGSWVMGRGSWVPSRVSWVVINNY